MSYPAHHRRTTCACLPCIPGTRGVHHHSNPNTDLSPCSRRQNECHNAWSSPHRSSTLCDTDSRHTRSREGYKSFCKSYTQTMTSMSCSKEGIREKGRAVSRGECSRNRASDTKPAAAHSRNILPTPRFLIEALGKAFGDFCMLQTILYTSNCRFDQSDTDQSTVSERSKENLV